MIPRPLEDSLELGSAQRAEEEGSFFLAVSEKGMTRPKGLRPDGQTEGVFAGGDAV